MRLVGDDPIYIAYHDDEWGVPSHDDRYLFEMLLLEGAQAGLNWRLISASARDIAVPTTASTRSGSRPGATRRSSVSRATPPSYATGSRSGRADERAGRARADRRVRRARALLLGLRGRPPHRQPLAERRRDAGVDAPCPSDWAASSGSAGSSSWARSSATRSCRRSGSSTTTRRLLPLPRPPDCRADAFGSVPGRQANPVHGPGCGPAGAAGAARRLRQRNGKLAYRQRKARLSSASRETW